MARRTPYTRTAAALGAAVVTLAGCGGSSSTGDKGTGAAGVRPALVETTVTGTVAVAPVASAQVAVYAVDPASGALYFAGATTTDGRGRFALTANAFGPLLLVAEGGSFVDPASGNPTPLGEPGGLSALDDARDGTLEALVGDGVAGGLTVNLNPLTTFASRRALARLGQDPDALEPGALAGLHAEVAREHGVVRGGSPVDPRQVTPLELAAADLAPRVRSDPTAPDVLLGLLAGAISEQASQTGVQTPDLLGALAADAGDGVFDGARPDGPDAAVEVRLPLPLGRSLPADAGTTALAAAARGFLAGNARNRVQLAAGDVDAFLAALARVDATPATNDAPRFAPLPDAAMPAGHPLAVTLRGLAAGPADEQGQAIAAVRATSSDPAVAADPRVAQSAGGAWTVTVDPLAPGQTTIAVTVEDDGGAAGGDRPRLTRRFELTVVDASRFNEAPSFDPVADVAVDEDSGALAVRVTGVDPNDPGQSVRLTAATSDPALVPPPVVSGGGAAWTLAMTPAADGFGQATITVTVQDDGSTLYGAVDTFSQGFVVDVRPVNDAPSFDPIASVSVVASAGVTDVPVTGLSGGPANEGQSVALTTSSSHPGVLPHPSAVVNGPAATLSLAPASGPGAIVTVTVTARDPDGTAHGGQDTFQRDFTVVVNGGGPASVTSLRPVAVSAAGGTRLTVATDGFVADFTQAAPTVLVGGQPATVVSAPDARTVVVDAPVAPVGSAALEVSTASKTATAPLEVVAPVAAGDVLVNEILADPSRGSDVLDANGDGDASSSSDEFVELVNARPTPIDLSGFVLRDGYAARHEFPNPTTVPPGGAVVVFGGGTPTGFGPVHADGHAQAATTGFLGLNDGGDRVELLEPGATNVVAAWDYTGSGAPDGVSANREVDGDAAAARVEHGQAGTAPGAADAVGRASPGTRVDGSGFPAPAPPAPPARAAVDAATPAAASAAGGTLVEVATSGFAEDFTQTAPTVALGGQPAAIDRVVDARTVVVVAPALPAGPAALDVETPTARASLAFDVVAAAGPGDVVVNEFLADPSPSGAPALDANGDGNPSTTEDEFVELVNTRATAVDLSGLEVHDGFGLRHAFPNPTVVPAGGALVVFGGGAPVGFAAAPASGHAQTASTGSLGLNNGGDTIELIAPGAPAPIDAVGYSASADGVSANRAVDGDVGAGFVEHARAASKAGNAAAGAVSPGRQADGSAFQ